MRHEAKYLTDEIIFWTNNELSYSSRADEKFTAVFDIMDRPVGRHHNYTSSLTLAHPASNINVQLSGHVGASYRSRTAGLLLAFTKALGDRKSIHLLGEFDTYLNKGKVTVCVEIRELTEPIILIKIRLIDRANYINIDPSVENLLESFVYRNSNCRVKVGHEPMTR